MKINLTWSTEDVMDKASEMQVEITELEANEILSKIERQHDCSIGVTWDTIENAIEELVSNPLKEYYIDLASLCVMARSVEDATKKGLIIKNTAIENSDIEIVGIDLL